MTRPVVRAGGNGRRENAAVSGVGSCILFYSILFCSVLFCSIQVNVWYSSELPQL
jgi:hypothetical protein